MCEQQPCILPHLAALPHSVPHHTAISVNLQLGWSGGDDGGYGHATHCSVTLYSVQYAKHCIKCK